MQVVMSFQQETELNSTKIIIFSIIFSDHFVSVWNQFLTKICQETNVFILTFLLVYLLYSEQIYPDFSPTQSKFPDFLPTFPDWKNFSHLSRYFSAGGDPVPSNWPSWSISLTHSIAQKGSVQVSGDRIPLQLESRSTLHWTKGV